MKIHIWQALHDTEARREMEKESLEQMIRIYCHGRLRLETHGQMSLHEDQDLLQPPA